MRKFPFKDAYCPYVLDGQLTIELHDGFRGLPEWFTREIVLKASKNENSLVEDMTDTLILLLLNTYENAESFYSNYFDGKLTLRDFIDLACLFTFRKDDIDWRKSLTAIKKLELADKTGMVLNDLDELFPQRFETLASEVQRLSSAWNLPFKERLVDAEKRRRAVLSVIRKDIANLTLKSKIGVRSRAAKDDKHDLRIGQSPSFEMLRDESGTKLAIHLQGEYTLENIAFSIFSFNINGSEPPLYMRVIARLESGHVKALLQKSNKLSDGVLAWNDAGFRLYASLEHSKLEVRIPTDKAHEIFGGGGKAIAIYTYEKHYEDVYWACCRGKTMITGEVPIGFLSLFADKPLKNVYIDLPTGKYIVSSDINPLIDKVLKLFDKSGTGMPLNCDDLPVRSCVIEFDAESKCSVSIEGVTVAAKTNEEKALSLLVQDITDWYVAETAKNSMLCHAASCAATDGSVLLMGPSGSGKTTLALALANVWPIRGDECACIDTETATTWAASLPVSTKPSDFAVELLAHGDEGVQCFSGIHGNTRLYNRSSFKADQRPETRQKIRAIVFPEYDRKYNKTVVKKIPQDNLVEKILHSLVGRQSPSANFRSFVRMVTKHHIPMIQIRYSSATQASHVLVNHLRDAKEHA